MNDTPNIALLIIAILLSLGAVAMVVRGLRARTRMANRAYGVERQEMRRDMLVSFSRGAVLLLVAFIVFAIYGLLPIKNDTGLGLTVPDAPDERPTAVTIETKTPSPSSAPSRTTETVSPSPSPTSLEEDPLNIEPTITSTISVQAATAVVDSINGLWLRSDPDSESDQLELIPNDSKLIVLRGLEPAELSEWQQVRAPSGNEGWVFIEFIVYQNDGS